MPALFFFFFKEKENYPVDLFMRENFFLKQKGEEYGWSEKENIKLACIQIVILLDREAMQFWNSFL